MKRPTILIVVTFTIMTLALPAYILWDMNPDIVNIPYFNHPVRWYGVLFAVGFFLGQQVMYYIYRKEGRPNGEIDTLTLYAVAATVLGARLGHVLFYDPAYYFSHPLKIFATWEGGLASHGGVIGMLVALYLFARKTQVPFLWVLDRIAIAGCVAGAAIRLGNLTNSEMVGIPTNLPWGFIFTLVDNVPRHPAQLYEALYCLVLFGLLFWLWFRFRETMRNGFLVGWFLVILFSLRFLDEFLKVNQEAFEDDMVLNMGQLLSIPFVLTGIIILVVTARQKKHSLVKTDDLSEGKPENA